MTDFTVPHRNGRSGLYAAQVAADAMMTEGWRDWHYGDEPCTYSGACNEPLRSHAHLSPGPGNPTVVVYYDDPRMPGTVPPEHRPTCPIDDQPCTSWTCLIDVCVDVRKESS